MFQCLCRVDLMLRIEADCRAIVSSSSLTFNIDTFNFASKMLLFLMEIFNYLDSIVLDFRASLRYILFFSGLPVYPT